jgi:hypothetical protein
MNRRNLQDMLLNRSAARQEIDTTQDEVIREVLEMAWWQVVRPFIGSIEGLSDEELSNLLPILPFDMLFYIQCVKRLVERKGYLSLFCQVISMQRIHYGILLSNFTKAML